MYSCILVYLLCSGVLQWLFSIVLLLQNLFESEDHQEPGGQELSEQTVPKRTQFSPSELKSSNT